MAVARQTTPAELDRWTRDGEYYEYSKAANPIGSGLISKVPLADFPARLHEEGPTRHHPVRPERGAAMLRAGDQPRPVRQLHPHQAGRRRRRRAPMRRPSSTS